jgi:hypothetical protein
VCGITLEGVRRQDPGVLTDDLTACHETSLIFLTAMNALLRVAFRDKQLLPGGLAAWQANRALEYREANLGSKM